MRVGLGCMRLHDAAVLESALAAGITLFDTARAYDGDNERRVGQAVGARAEIVTKGGMRRPDGRWVPDGRARALREDAAASRVALGRPPDYFLLHAPDPRVPLATSVRALAAIREAGDARAIGLSNVSRTQLEEAMAVTRIDAVEVALGAFDDAPLRGGLVELCADRDIVVFAHSPLGGPRRAARLVDDPVAGGAGGGSRSHAGADRPSLAVRSRRGAVAGSDPDRDGDRGGGGGEHHVDAP